LLFSFDHLSHLFIKNHDLHGFVVQWNHVLDNMGENAVNKRTLRDVFFRKIRDEKELQYDVNQYERMDDKDENKSCDYLMNCVNSVI
jgi:predicted DNA binding protein